jgi:hypothetical protein
MLVIGILDQSRRMLIITLGAPMSPVHSGVVSSKRKAYELASICIGSDRFAQQMLIRSHLIVTFGS